MSRGFNLADYEPVEDRLQRFWADNPNGRVHTSQVEAPEKSWIVRAEVYRKLSDEHPSATGLAQEVIGSSNVNRTSALENCETSAIGRALANLGYAAKGTRPSREEMAKTETVAPPTDDVTTTKKAVWDLIDGAVTNGRITKGRVLKQAREAAGPSAASLPVQYDDIPNLLDLWALEELQREVAPSG